MSLKATATDIKDVEARSPATSASASADSPCVSMNLAEPFTTSSGAAAHSPEPAACSHGPVDVSTALPTSQTLAERSTIPQAADVQETSNYAGQAQQTAVTEVLQETGAQIHGNDFLIQAIRLLFVRIGRALAFCLWVPTRDFALELLHSILQAGSMHPDRLDACVGWDQEEPTVPMSEAAPMTPQRSRSNTSASQKRFTGYLDSMDAHANEDQHVHELPVPALDMTPTMPGTGSEGRPLHASRQRLSRSALQAGSARVAHHAKPGQLSVLGSSVPGGALALQSVLPSVMLSVQSCREVLQAPELQTQVCQHHSPTVRFCQHHSPVVSSCQQHSLRLEFCQQHSLRLRSCQHRSFTVGSCQHHSLTSRLRQICHLLSLSMTCISSTILGAQASLRSQLVWPLIQGLIKRKQPLWLLFGGSILCFQRQLSSRKHCSMKGARHGKQLSSYHASSDGVRQPPWLQLQLLSLQMFVWFVWMLARTGRACLVVI